MIDISTYNGDATDKYKWSQQFNEVLIQVDLPKGTRGRDLEVVIDTQRLKVKLKKESEAIINGKLCEKVKTDDCFWNIEDEERLIITLAKQGEVIWKTIIEGDKEIDTKTVDNSKKLEDFDTETQGHLRKVLYEQERKKAGLPTTEEEEQMKAMQKVFGANNSPFQGQPYDPSTFTGG